MGKINEPPKKSNEFEQFSVIFSIKTIPEQWKSNVHHKYVRQVTELIATITLMRNYG